MKIPHKKSLFAGLVAFILTGCGNYEEASFAVLEKIDNIEIRLYEPTLLAEIDLPGTHEDATTEGFQMLFKYISQQNSDARSIEMTIPVLQTFNTRTQEWTTAFHLPKHFTYAKVPAPNNPKIRIKKRPRVKMASIQFKGTGSHENIKKHAKQLAKYLEKNNITFKNTPVAAFYNGPITPGFMRRNEVLYLLIE